MYGYICEFCESHLDPGEKCDCREAEQKKREKRIEASRLLENCETYEQLELAL